MLVPLEKRDELAPHVNVAIPPAWTEVMVETDPSKRVWVVGRDSVGRLMRIYSPEWVRNSKDAKFGRVRALILEWEDIRSELESVLNSSKTTSATYEAALVAYLIYNTGIRPGSRAEVALKTGIKAYGATTLQCRHIRPSPKGVRLKFVGKKGVPQSVLVVNPYLVRVMRKRASEGSPRDPVFQCSDNQLRVFFDSLGTGQYTPKDFRTARGTMLATELLKRSRWPRAKKARKALFNAALDKVAKALGNTRAVCKSAYVDPQVMEPWVARLS